jgi:hypothetical protein
MLIYIYIYIYISLDSTEQTIQVYYAFLIKLMCKQRLIFTPTLRHPNPIRMSYFLYAKTIKFLMSYVYGVCINGKSAVVLYFDM